MISFGAVLVHVERAEEYAQRFECRYPEEEVLNGGHIVDAEEIGPRCGDVGGEVAVSGDAKEQDARQKVQGDGPPEVAKPFGGDFGAGVERGDGVEAGDSDHPGDDPVVGRVLGSMG